MVSSNVNLALEFLEWIEKNNEELKFPIEDKFQTLRVELKFLKTFVMNTVNWRDDHELVCLASILARIDKLTENAASLRSLHLKPINEHLAAELECTVSRMRKLLKTFRPTIREAYVIFSGDAWRFNPPVSGELIAELFDSLLENLIDLRIWKVDLDPPFKEKVTGLEENLRFLRDFIPSPAKQCLNDKTLTYIMRYAEAVAYDTSCLSYICWADETAEGTKIEISLKLEGLLQKVKTINPQMLCIYSAVTRTLKSSKSDSLMMHDVMKSFVSLLLKDLNKLQNFEASVTDLIEILFAAQFFLTNSFNNQPEDNGSENLNDLREIVRAAASEAGSVVYSFYVGKMEEGMTRDTKVLLMEFFKKIKCLRAEVKFHFNIPKLSCTNFPKIGDLGFIEFLLGKLSQLLMRKPALIAFVMHEIESIQEDLISLRSFIANPYDEHLINLRRRVTNAAYEAEYAIDSLLAGDSPLVCHLLYLLDVMEEIKVIKTEVNNNEVVNNSICRVAKTSDDDAVVGVKDESQSIIDQLTTGSTQLEIVSIVGMPGIGKTTLAKRVYNDPLVARHFHIRAWCYVSQFYEMRQMLLDILSDVIELTEKISKMVEEELAEKLYKSLKGRRYLLIMDDVWNIGAWNDLSDSFPNDSNGSRIMFTSRIHYVALETKYNCSSHPLRLLSEEESWKLLQEKIFFKSGCPPSLVHIGRRIAKNCKGLPLALVVIAGLLSRTEKRQDWWEQVAESLNSRISGDALKEFRNISELSYKHLPDHLKPCFLYFGAFLEDKEIPVRNLTWIWIAEGFVRNSHELKSLEQVAEEYLTDLEQRSLINVSKRRSTGGIKICHLHDLLHGFCVAKAKEEKFFQLVCGNDDYLICSSRASSSTGDSSLPMTCQLRRLSIDSSRFQFTDSAPSESNVRSLLFFASTNRHSFEHIGIPFIFEKFKLLKVLDLGCIILGNLFPSEVESLIHLRYLAIRGCMNSIPSAIACLFNLQTFLVKGLKGEILLPESIWDLVRLRHLHVNDRAAFNLKNYELKDSCGLQNLETLSSPSLSYGEDAEKMLRRLSRLRKLRCIFFDSSNSSENQDQLPVLDFLSQLESLKVFYHGSPLHSCKFHFPSNLKKLTLSKFRLPWSQITTIARLPNLEVLKLLFKAFEGTQWNVEDDEFPKLKFLKLDNLSIVVWNVSSDPFPRLEQLVLQRCKQLEEIPSTFGEILTLRTIQVHWCSQSAAKSAKQIQESQADMGNELELLIH